MLVRRPHRALPLLAAVVAALTLAACGGPVIVPEAGPKVDPAPAKKVLTEYLNDDRCDLISDHLAGTIDPDPDHGRDLCAHGQLPVDALVKAGQWTFKTAEVIDGDGLITIELDDGGTRDYVLTPGGKEGFQINSVKTTTAAEIGQPLRLQARDDSDGPAVDARVTVLTLRRIPTKDLSQDEFTSYLNHYYRVKVRVHSLSSAPIQVGSLGFALAQKNDVDVAQPVAPFSDIGAALPTVVDPGKTITGWLFFIVPSERIARPNQVVFTMGVGTTGAKLVWLKK